jgi:predicted kinase
MLIGLSGSGKSHLADAVASRLGAALVSSDGTRRRLLGLAPGQRADAPYGRGPYAPETRARVYAAMHARAAEHLRHGRGVLLDATYASRDEREAARHMAEAAAAPLLALEVQADEAAVRRHLALREAEPHPASDARWEVYLAQRQHFEPPDEFAPNRRLRVDGGLPLRENVGRVLAFVRDAIR